MTPDIQRLRELCHKSIFAVSIQDVTLIRSDALDLLFLVESKDEQIAELRRALARHQCVHGVDEHDECEKCMDEAEREHLRAMEADRG